MVSLTPRYWRSAAGERDPERAGDSSRRCRQQRGADDVAGQRQRVGQRRAGQPAEHQRAFAADDHEPGARRQRDAQAR